MSILNDVCCAVFSGLKTHWCGSWGEDNEAADHSPAPARPSPTEPCRSSHQPTSGPAISSYLPPSPLTLCYTLSVSAYVTLTTIWSSDQYKILCSNEETGYLSTELKNDSSSSPLKKITGTIHLVLPPTMVVTDRASVAIRTSEDSIICN